MGFDRDVLSSRALKRRSMLRAAGAVAATGALVSGARASVVPEGKRGDGVRDVVVIGAGLSGLTAARDLVRAGCEKVLVLEARDRVGGRTFNHDLGGGVISEGGGEWIGPSQTAIADLARELGVGTFDSFYAGKSVYLAGETSFAQDNGNGGTGTPAAIVGKLADLARKVTSGTPWTAADAAALDRISFGDWLAQQGVGAEDLFSIGRSTRLSFGVPPASLSFLYYLSVLNSSDCSVEKLESMKGGAQQTRLVGGSQRLSQEMARALGERVRLSSPVRRISGWDRDLVEIETDRGLVRARQVIAALSPSLCNRIAFDPPLPAGRAELQRRWPAHAPMRKTVHVYPRPFWREAGLNGQILQVDGPLLWCCDNSPPDASLGVINAFVEPGRLPADPKAAEAVLSQIYAQALGEAARHPVQFHDLDWGKLDDWSLSCTSPLPAGFLTALGPHLSAPVGRLLWAGTETADIWSGAMDGAVRAGHRAALQALGALAKA